MAVNMGLKLQVVFTSLTEIGTEFVSKMKGDQLSKAEQASDNRHMF